MWMIIVLLLVAIIVTVITIIYVDKENPIEVFEHKHLESSASNSELTSSELTRVNTYYLAILIGCILGGVIGFLLRPSVFLVGQLPFETVITGGLRLKGIEELLLVPLARRSFWYLVGAALIGGYRIRSNNKPSRNCFGQTKQNS